MIEEMPTFVDEWIELSRHASMFPIGIKQHGLSEWEVQYCLWWFDYPIGEYPRHEGDLYKGILLLPFSNYSFSIVFCVVLYINPNNILL